MVERIDQALCAIQTALVARELYDEAHPAVVKARSEAIRLLGNVLQQSPAIQVTAIDHRVVVQGTTLSSSASLTAGLFARLRRFQFDGVMFRRGVRAEELDTFLKCLAPTAIVDEFPKLPGIVPMRVVEGDAQKHSSSADRSHVGRPVLAPTLALIAPRKGAALMAPLLTRIIKDGVLDDDALGNVIGNINAIVTGAENTMIPLASLKQHDEYTYVHTINVGLLSAALGEAVGVTGDRLYELISAALLHDVGKRLIPLEVLNKPGKLNDDEARVVRSHPELGARLLLAVPSLPPIVPIVAYEHHMERTGGGYPHAPAHWKMHLASQIVQIADVYDALRTNRPYRQAMSLDQVREIMSKDVGTRYDAELLRVFFDEVSSNTDREVTESLMGSTRKAA